MTPRQTRPIEQVACPECGNTAIGSPSGCPRCGADLRGLGESSETLVPGAAPLATHLPEGWAPGTIIDRRYRLREKLGEGGMGAVWRAEHVRMGKAVALKLLQPEAALDRNSLKRFQQEARIVSRLTHPNTVSVFDFGTAEDGSLYLAMELVPGRDLAEVLEASGPMGERRAVSIAAQVLRSLAQAHEAGVVHRDVKPANVMLCRTREGEDFVKLVDFGIATMAKAAGSEGAIGTPQYMSPEQLRAEDLDARSDLYSVGVLLFELLTGQCPFSGETPLEAASARLAGPPPDPRLYAPELRLSPGLEAVLARALAVDRRERWGSADEMRAGLAVAAVGFADPKESEPGSFEPLSLGPADLEVLHREEWDAFERRLRRRHQLAPLLAVAALGGVGLSAWLALGEPSEPARAPVSVEVEPNDGPATANLLAPGTSVRGFVQRRVREQSDFDLFEFEVLGFEPQLARISASGVPNVNLALDLFVLDGTEGRLPNLGHADDLFLGGGEALSDLELAPGRYLVRLSDKLRADEDGGSPRENTLDPYVLQVELSALPRFPEREPDNALPEAMRLRPARPVFGHAGAKPEPTRRHAAAGEVARRTGLWSEDFYEVGLGEGASSSCALLAGVPGASLGLSLVGADLDRLRMRADGERALVEHLAALSARERPLSIAAGEIGRRCARASASAAFKVEVLEGASDEPYVLVAIDDTPGGLAGVLELCGDPAGKALCKRLLAKSLQALPGAPWAALARDRLAALR